MVFPQLTTHFSILNCLNVLFIKKKKTAKKKKKKKKTFMDRDHLNRKLTAILTPKHRIISNHQKVNYVIFVIYRVHTVYFQSDKLVKLAWKYTQYVMHI